MFRYIAMVVALVLFAKLSTAQATLDHKFNRHKVGITSGYGGSDFLDQKNSYEYRVHLIQLQYYRTLLHKRSFNLEIQFEPQYNRSYYKYNVDSDTEHQGYEFGINVGILIRKHLFGRNMAFYFILSAGPHYISDAPLRQATGFIFSDNIFIGANIRIGEKLYLDMRVGFRHLSNAGLKKPNGGINNYTLNSGLVIEL